jgi:membrane fusion protein (multidrug efflux system)
MRPRFKTLVFGVAALSLVLAACKAPQKKEASTGAASGLYPVKVFKVVRGSISEKVLATGAIEAWRKTTITPDVGGKIAAIYVNEGDFVRAGQLLAELDTQATRLQLKQAEAGFLVAQAGLKDAQKNKERMDQLMAEKAVSEQQHEKIQLAFEAASAQFAQAQAALQLAKHALEVSIMKAPFGGVIASRNAEVGDVINPMMGGFSPTSGVLTLVDFSRIKIDVELSQDEVLLVKKGQRAVARVSIFPGREFEGKVSVVNLAGDPTTKKFGVEVAVNNPDLVLRPGTFGEVVLEVRTHDRAIVLPQMAILENAYVFLIQNGKAVRRDIRLGLQNRTLVEITAGLAEGDRVVAEGNFGLEDGAAVEIIGEVTL